MVIHRTHPYPAYGGPGAVTGDVAGRQGRRADPLRIGYEQGGKGVNPPSRDVGSRCGLLDACVTVGLKSQSDKYKVPILRSQLS